MQTQFTIYMNNNTVYHYCADSIDCAIAALNLDYDQIAMWLEG